jgi:hypothetical protein
MKPPDAEAVHLRVNRARKQPEEGTIMHKCIRCKAQITKAEKKFHKNNILNG